MPGRSMDIMNCSICKVRPRAKSTYYCKPCHAIYQSKYAKRTSYKDAKKSKDKLRQFIVDAKDRPCQDCGISYPWYILDFDHVRGQKLFNLSTAANKKYSLARIKQEIAKCDIVCANCHRERTFRFSIKASAEGSEPSTEVGRYHQPEPFIYA